MESKCAVNLLNSSLAALTWGIKVRRLFMAKQKGERIPKPGVEGERGTASYL